MEQINLSYNISASILAKITGKIGCLKHLFAMIFILIRGVGVQMGEQERVRVPGYSTVKVNRALSARLPARS